MLEFNPHFRITTSEALSSNIFDKFRIAHYEKPCNLTFDHEIFSPVTIDYETGENKKYEIKDYKRFLYIEIKKL